MRYVSDLYTHAELIRIQGVTLAVCSMETAVGALECICYGPYQNSVSINTARAVLILTEGPVSIDAARAVLMLTGKPVSINTGRFARAVLILPTFPL